MRGLFSEILVIFLYVQEYECVGEQFSQKSSEPLDLANCLEAFTTEEHLSDDEKYYCSKCKGHQPASKKLQIWRLPPILVSIGLGGFRCLLGFLWCWWSSLKNQSIRQNLCVKNILKKVLLVLKPRLHEHPSRQWISSQQPSRSFECTSRTFA